MRTREGTGKEPKQRCWLYKEDEEGRKVGTLEESKNERDKRRKSMWRGAAVSEQLGKQTDSKRRPPCCSAAG